MITAPSDTVETPLPKIPERIFKVEGGRYRTQSLFLEHDYDREKAIYTLKDDDYLFEGVLYPSLKKLYLEMEDLGEYTFANTHLGGWGHWEAICNNKAFKALVETWRYELELKMRGRAIAAIAKEIGTNSRGAQSAAKWIADRGWAVKKAGRPSQEDVQAETKMLMDVANDYKADVVRLKT